MKSLCTVITHKVGNKFKGIKFEDDMQDLLNKGCLSFKGFCEVYNKQDHDFTAQEPGFSRRNSDLPFLLSAQTLEMLVTIRKTQK